MASSPSELTLDYTPNGVGGKVASSGGSYPMMIAKQAAARLVDGCGGGGHHVTAEQAAQKLQEFVARLEEERLKIDAFKRELPLCMQLLNHAMEAYRQQLEACQVGSHGAAAAAAPTRPLVLEEFIPLKNIGAVDAAADKPGNPPSEKASWMVSAQLWNGPAADSSAAKGPPTPKERSEHPPDASPAMLGALDGRRNGAGFLPFTKDSSTAESVALPELALAAGAIVPSAAAAAATAEVDYNGAVAMRDVQNGVPPPPELQSVQPPPPPQTIRKARRCWSPELHRRFVNALQILGGAQVATPKQIRELMKVDGLTNDEVKSHLQKYRLHTRRPMAGPVTPTAGAPQLVVLGGIWMPPEYTAQGAAPAIYGAHPMTQAHYTAAVSAAATQDYYQSATHHGHHHHQPQPPMMHRTHAAPPPAAAARGPSGSSTLGSKGGERSESIEEEGEERDDDYEEDDMGADADAEETSAAINSTANGDMAAGVISH